MKKNGNTGIIVARDFTLLFEDCFVSSHLFVKKYKKLSSIRANLKAAIDRQNITFSENNYRQKTTKCHRDAGFKMFSFTIIGQIYLHSPLGVKPKIYSSIGSVRTSKRHYDCYKIHATSK